MEMMKDTFIPVNQPEYSNHFWAYCSGKIKLDTEGVEIGHG